MDNTKLKELLIGELGSESVTEALGEVVAEVDKNKLLNLSAKLIAEPYGLDFLTNLTVVDYPENYTMVYNLRSVTHKYPLTVITKIEKNEPNVPSVFEVWKTADWQEREVYDLFGIHFTGHPDLRRILLQDDFEGYPLRKDFKLQARR